MKKIMSVILCVFMTLALSVNMFAEGAAAPNVPTFTSKNTYAVDISNPSVSSDQVLAGETFNITFNLGSNGYYTIIDSQGNEYPGSTFWDNTAKMSVTVSGDGFTLAGSLAERRIGQGFNTITVLADKDMEEGRHTLTMTVSCTKNSSTTSATQTFNIDIVASSVDLEEDPQTPKVTMTGATIPEGKGKSNLATKLTAVFKNTGSIDISDITATISAFNDLSLNTYTDTIELGDLAVGSSVKAKFPVKFPEYPSGQSSATITLKYRDSLGNEHSSDYNVYIQSREKEKPESTGDKTLEPKVIVSNYSVDVEKIVSGEQFTLTFVLKNTSHDKDVMNMTVDVNTSSSGSSGTGGNNTSTPETVFSPIDGTTSFYTEKLEKDGEIEYVIKLKTSASAGAKSYPIQIEYDFQYESNEAYVSSNGNSMTINLPVTQPIKFELMEWNPPTECPIDGTAISFQYFNKSKNPMTNLAVSVEGDFTMSTQYVGTLNASSYDFFNGTIVPAEGAKVGDTKKGVLVFTFEDASSNEQRVEYPIEATITEAAGGANGDPGMMGGDMAFDPGMMGGDMIEPGPGMPGGEMPVDGEGVEQGGMAPALKWGLIIGVPVVVLIVIIIVVVAVKKRKARLLEDDDDE